MSATAASSLAISADTPTSAGRGYAWPSSSISTRMRPASAALRKWMNEQGIPAGGDLGPQDLKRAIEFREAMRLLLLSNNGVELEASALRGLRAAADAGLIRVEIEKDGQAFARPAEEGVSALFARLLAAVADIQCAGTWERLKACAAEDCQWAFYDTSRNRSRTWCSMEVCGNRAKTRAYRARLTDG